MVLDENEDPFGNVGQKSAKQAKRVGSSPRPALSPATVNGSARTSISRSKVPSFHLQGDPI